jgi:glucose-6-phosphate 1-dehydrogenase
MIDNWRWAGVPFYLRTGKALKSKRTEVAIKFKQAPFAMFRDTPIDRLAQNFLVISIQPDECIGLQFSAKVPGPVIAISGVGMTFKYQDYFDAAPSTRYETLIYDCMIGDAFCSNGRMGSRPVGEWSNRSSMHGVAQGRMGLRSMRLVARGRMKPTSF